jgi:DNA replication initiation complex subunit (GINS family)
MLSDITDNLCALRREQKDSLTLLSPSQVSGLVNKAETRLAQLKQLHATCKTEEEREELTDEHECISGALDDIQERRSEMIWDLAYHGAGTVSLMTEREADIYQKLSTIARDLRGR